MKIKGRTVEFGAALKNKDANIYRPIKPVPKKRAAKGKIKTFQGWARFHKGKITYIRTCLPMFVDRHLYTEVTITIKGRK